MTRSGTIVGKRSHLDVEDRGVEPPKKRTVALGKTPNVRLLSDREKDGSEEIVGDACGESIPELSFQEKEGRYEEVEDVARRIVRPQHPVTSRSILDTPPSSPEIMPRDHKSVDTPGKTSSVVASQNNETVSLPLNEPTEKDAEPEGETGFPVPCEDVASLLDNQEEPRGRVQSSLLQGKETSRKTTATDKVNTQSAQAVISEMKEEMKELCNLHGERHHEILNEITRCFGEMSSRISCLQKKMGQNNDHISALTTSTVYHLSSSSVSDCLEYLLAPMQKMFEGTHYRSLFSIVCVVFLYDSVKDGSYDIIEDDNMKMFAKKLGLALASIMYIRKPNDKGKEGLINSINESNTSFRIRFHKANSAFLCRSNTIGVEKMITKEGVVSVTKPFWLRSGFLRLSHIEDVVREVQTSKHLPSTRRSQDTNQGKRKISKELEEDQVNSNPRRGTNRNGRKRSWQLMMEYESTFPDDESIAKGIVFRMNSTCNGTLNRLRERVRNSFYLGLGYLWEPALSLEYIKIPPCPFEVDLESVPETEVAGRRSNVGSKMPNVAEGNLSKWKEVVLKYSNQFCFLISYQVRVYEGNMPSKEIRIRRVLKVMDEALRFVLKMTFHSRVEDLLSTNKQVIRVIVYVSCLFREIVFCNIREGRDGFPVNLTDTTLSHLVNELVPSSAPSRKHLLEGILQLSRTKFEDLNIADDFETVCRIYTATSHGQEVERHEAEEMSEEDEIVALAGNLASEWE